MNRHIYWIWLRMALSGNIKLMYALYTVVGDVEQIFRADSARYLEWGVDPSLIKTLSDKDLSSAYNILGQCERFDIHILTIEDDDFPDALRQIALPPCMLFYQGDLPGCLSGPALTVIGTRHSTATGESIAADFSEHLSLSGFSIVCGVAEGIETVIQKSVVKADGRCVLLLPCGILMAGKRVKYMIRDVLPHGAVVSELLPHERSPYDAYHMRNRLLSGLTEGTLVLQAPIKSGTSITANYAIQQGKDVFVLPGSVRDPSFAGNNRLLRDGAVPIIDYTDIVDYYRPKWKDALQDTVIEDTAFEQFVSSITAGNEFDDETQQSVYSTITPDGVTVDEIVMKCGLPTPVVLSQLTVMEMKGWIAPMPGGKYKSIT